MLAAADLVAPSPDPVARYRALRRQTEALCRPLAPDDYGVQSVPETSPPKWHLAHVTWFFETFLLTPYVPGYRPLAPDYATLFNSYYYGLGAPLPRERRHLLSRPTIDEVYRYRAHVDDAMEHLLAVASARHAAAQRLELGLNHEQQHQELLLMDIKHNFAAQPRRPAYHELAMADDPAAGELQWLERSGGVGAIGHEGEGFAFDNERPRHRVFLEDYRIAARPVTNGEYRAFIKAGGYREPQWWTADGWTAVRAHGWSAPLYWEQREGAWREMTLHGLVPLAAEAPVCHVSWYEADAYARWCDARLPTEAEWETAAARCPVVGDFSDDARYQPAATGARASWFGGVWQWTASPYTPYPGFRASGDALGEYNGKFMANQYVLRGGSCLTPRTHMRLTYRNFFYPHDRWVCAGIRLARDA